MSDNTKPYEDEEDDEEEPAAFNDALKTLERVCRPLDELQLLNMMYPSDSPEKQRAFINLVTRFFVLCAPLLKLEDSNTYKEKILKMQVPKRSIIKSGVQTFKNNFDPQLDYELWVILIDIQQKIKKYLMPQRREDEGL